MNGRTIAPEPSRRGFLKTIICGVISGVLGLVPLVAGVVVFLDPLRKRSSDLSTVRVASLDALPADGIPLKFPVLATRVDAWNKFKEVPIGAVYLRRMTDGQVQAFNVVCPHAGCYVDFLPERGKYLCPCHNSTFNIAGRIDDPRSPAPRGLDALDVQVKEGNEIWVKFQNFQAGRAEKVPVA
jgi:menaquinol-cytochrome c reductase iron-sulfur subunit